MSQRKYFGTDGIRGHVGLSNINPEFVLKLGWAVGRVLANGQRKKVVIGKDTRVSGYMLESALEAGLSAAGVDVALLGPMPTPAIAYLTQTLRANAGIVISASHNLFEDNGIKFFSSEGGKLPDSVELAIEAELETKMQTVPSQNLGKATRINDASGRYIEFCKSTIPSLTRLSGLKIVVDCANGATYHIAPNVFSELGAQVISIGNRPDGFNINEDCGSTSPELLRQKVISTGADIGVGLDGDGDRVILIDSDGRLIDGDQILYIIAKDRHQRGVLNGGVVGTQMSNYGLEIAIKSLGIPFVRTRVGDRYVLEALREKDWKIGGETSGHIVCLDKTTTGDGIVAALQVLSIMVKQGKTLQQLIQGINLLPQSLVNLKTNYATLLAEHSQVVEIVRALESSLNGEGRVLLRPSGTEPLLRVMVEGLDESMVKRHAQKLCDDISQIERNLNI
ncbi:MULTISPECIES: phosphoglucosamine mutase [Legionella]|uniref:Phosphoglucosamine mutase n=1 Tax=Legionella resiliens TaxID=2905958 RepID=A0ABS8WY65_9GAMM|nr:MULTISPECIES: phosphoglucosamine mutase [unclassified Legionella]MCE0722282.1 phosphoglucosamine mutase [Legionella sp. 9fVS26]MCE3531436.1 phosphoglucosamine mutase [Legionella sp. 8cVS16]QLZ67456.1 phosphoglucosamine mutase [Legionella sp. PC1000]